MKNIFKIIGIVGMLMGVNACYYDNPPELIPFDCAEVSYVTHVQPIWDKSCATSGCHDGSHEPKLTSDVSWNNLVSGGYIDLQFPESSLVYKTVIFEESPMPPGGPKISPLEVELILCWITEKALNN